MKSTEHADERSRWVTPALLIAAIIVYVAGPLIAPSELGDLYELDSLTDKYSAIASNDAAYRWANLAAAAAATLGALAILRLVQARGGGSGPRIAALAFTIGAAAWAVHSLLRMTLVVERADDVATGAAPDRGAVTDAALQGDGPFVAATLIVGVALVGLAVAWRRTGDLGWPTTVLLGLAGLTTVVTVRSDPVAIAFISPFPFFLAFVPLAVVTVRQARLPSAGSTTVNARA